MISTLATKISNRLYAASVIEESDKELYTYGFFILISRLFYLIVSVLCGLLLGVLWESVLFYMMFMLLRSYAGGMHAKTESMCSVLTTLSLLASICGIKVLNFVQNEKISLVILSIGAVCIIALSPLDTVQKPLEIAERDLYRRISIIIVAAYLMLALLMYVVGMNGVLNAVAGSVALESALIIAGKIMRLREEI